MDPFTLVSGVLGAGSSIFGSLMGRQTAQDQMQFQQMMSSTAYQRASADMKAAGLNPMMMFGSGSAASTPPGAMNPNTGGFGQAGDILSKTVSSAVQSSVMQKTMDKMTDEMAKLKEETLRTKADTALTQQRTKTESAETDIRGAQIIPALLERDKSQAERDIIDNALGKKIFQGGVIGDWSARAVRPITDIVGGVTASRRSLMEGRRFRLDRDKFEDNRNFGHWE